MSEFKKSLSQPYLILGTAIAACGSALGAIALLTACSQPPVNEPPNLKSSPKDTAEAPPPKTPTSVREKPVVSQQTDKTTLISQTELRSCRAGDLQAVLDDYQGGAGSRYGRIKFTNSANTACVLQGRPQIELLNSVGKSLPLKEGALQSGEVASKVIVQPQQPAYLAFRWSNWCLKEPNNEIKFVVNLPGEAGQVPVILPDEPKPTPPPCNGPDQPSSLSVRVFSSTPSP